MRNSLAIKLVRHLIESKSFQGEKCSNKKNGYILGLRDGCVIYDIERAVSTFLKVLNLIQFFKKDQLSILFIGSPYELEKTLERLLVNSSHKFTRFSNWIPGALSNVKNEKMLPNMVITYDCKSATLNSEIMKCGIPIVSFTEVDSSSIFVDYPIFLNINSEGAKNMYLLLVKASVA